MQNGLDIFQSIQTFAVGERTGSVQAVRREVPLEIQQAQADAVWEVDEGGVIANRTWKTNFDKRDYEEKISVITPFQGELQGKQVDELLPGARTNRLPLLW